MKATVPWATDTLWEAIQDAIRASLYQGASNLSQARRDADMIAHLLELMADCFDQLAAESCEICLEPCCRHAKVWLDFQDLLFIHLHRETLPPHQLRRNLREPCRYLGVRGCTLPRLSRPWICTWYICSNQRRILERDHPGALIHTSATLTRVKSLRQRMETAFLEALGVSPAP